MRRLKIEDVELAWKSASVVPRPVLRRDDDDDDDDEESAPRMARNGAFGVLTVLPSVAAEGCSICILFGRGRLRIGNA